MLYSKNECWAQNFFVEEKKRRKIEDAKTEDIIGLFFGQTIFFNTGMKNTPYEKKVTSQSKEEDILLLYLNNNFHVTVLFILITVSIGSTVLVYVHILFTNNNYIPVPYIKHTKKPATSIVQNITSNQQTNQPTNQPTNQQTIQSLIHLPTNK